MFATVLYKVLDPRNIGLILRSHMAFGGDEFIFMGYDKDFKMGKKWAGTSRALEKKIESIYFPDSKEFFLWAMKREYTTFAVEIGEKAMDLPKVKFTSKPAFILGNEQRGIPLEIINQCAGQLRIPMFGKIGSLNVGVSASVCYYEYMRLHKTDRAVEGSRYSL